MSSLDKFVSNASNASDVVVNAQAVPAMRLPILRFSCTRINMEMSHSPVARSSHHLHSVCKSVDNVSRGGCMFTIIGHVQRVYDYRICTAGRILHSFIDGSSYFCFVAKNVYIALFH